MRSVKCLVKKTKMKMKLRKWDAETKMKMKLRKWHAAEASISRLSLLRYYFIAPFEKTDHCLIMLV